MKLKVLLCVSSIFILLIELAFSQPPFIVNGGGASFPSLVYIAGSDSFIAERPDLKVIYNVTGSGIGIQNMINGNWVFAGSDIVLSDSHYEQAPDLQLLPFIAGGIAPFIKSFDTPLTFSRQLLVDIFLNNIKYWDDPQILSFNPGLSLPHVPIRIIYHKNSSGTTLAFTSALSKFSEEWNSRYGPVSVWPEDLRNQTDVYYSGTGNEGSLILSSVVPYSISYLSYNFAYSSLSQQYCAKMINKAGNTITINTPSITAATVGAVFDSRLATDISDAPGEGAWPISTFTYMVVRMNSTDPSRCRELKEAMCFFNYGLKYYITFLLVGLNGMATSTPDIRDLIAGKMNEITCDGQNVYSFADPDDPAPSPPNYYYNAQPQYSTINDVSYSPYYNDIGSIIDAASAKEYEPTNIKSLYYPDIVYINYYDKVNASSSSGAEKLRTPNSLHLLILQVIGYSLGFFFSSNCQRRTSFATILILVAIFSLVTPVPRASAQQFTELRVAGFFPLSGYLSPWGPSSEAAARFSLNFLNPAILNPLNYTLSFKQYDDRSNTLGAEQSLSDARTSFNMFGGIGAHDNTATSILALSASLFYYPLISYGSRANFLSDRSVYPYFARVIPPYRSEGLCIANLAKLYGWDKLGLIITSDDYGTGCGAAFVAEMKAAGAKVTVVQFSPGDTQLDAQMSVIRDSNVRVVALFAGSTEDTKTALLEADRYHMIRDDYVWFAGSFASTSSLYYNSTTQETNALVKFLAKGLITLKLKGGYGDNFEFFLDMWSQVPLEYFSGAGKRSIPLYGPYAYDAMELFVRTFIVNPMATLTEFMANLKDVSFTGLTGPIVMDETGVDRLAIYDIVNLPNQYSNQGDRGFVVIGDWFETDMNSTTNGFSFTTSIVFHSGDTNPPPPEVRPPIDYWVCSEGKKKTDETGMIRLDPPGPDAENIAHHYYCDTFMDCHNFSDESGQCSSNYTAVFIVFGIITGVLIIITILLIPFTIIFGLCLNVIRIRSASPPFLIILLISIIVGYGSVFTWFGQPNAVACGFQAWLLGLSVNSMIAVLVAKNYRIWKIFRNPLKRKAISDKEVNVLYIAIMIPGVIILILWTAISTPTAELKDIGGDPHWVCDTGGATGPPGGIIFFFIFVGYTGLVLGIGAIASLGIRKVPSLFNESRLIAISIYNILILAAIIIPIFFVLLVFNPFVGWIIRTMAIIYAFSATLALTFIPKVVGVLRDFYNGKAIVSTSGAEFSTSGSSSSHNPSNASSTGTV